ncbi:TatD family hydrolase [Sinimarinibacterium sp. NLF-5-8]|uniref:TatD family hydrolase n=1 Tax=Sinimarinibacterium sp. NLF-5-8 TaxID=2698684 RepID=UPI00137C1B42|nr:TatD family hydrolase [Sinimarinibacterium sp. NLF-5-8]QHS08798.1 hydrolase TatD [Sinimarinibacterium sp. NLF-5-8]
MDTTHTWALVDIGVNLAHDSFATDLDAVLARARDAGVMQMVITGSDAASNQAAQQMAATHRGQLFATAGLHPHYASAWGAALATQIDALAQSPEVVSLGECGLDYFRDLSPRAVQQQAFTAQLDLAVKHRKPVFLHQRDAHADFLAILREYRAQLPAVVVHCFTDTAAALADYLALDCHIGITGWICDERRGKHLIEAVTMVPDERLMIETDSPYLLPRTAPKTSSRRNEPAYLPWVVKAIAHARGQPESYVADMSARTARRFFGLPMPG